MSHLIFVFIPIRSLMTNIKWVIILSNYSLLLFFTWGRKITHFYCFFIGSRKITHFYCFLLGAEKWLTFTDFYWGQNNYSLLLFLLGAIQLPTFAVSFLYKSNAIIFDCRLTYSCNNNMYNYMIFMYIYIPLHNNHLSFIYIKLTVNFSVNIYVIHIYIQYIHIYIGCV